MATLKEIAKKAGVSVGTVSKVLNNRIGKQNFRPECIRGIKEIAQQLGYIPNYHARSLKSGQSHTIGLLLGIDSEVLWNDYWAKLVGGMMSKAQSRNYHFININEGDSESSGETALQFLKEQRIDALVVPYYSKFAADVSLFSGENYPVVLALNPEKSALPSVSVDDVVGIGALVEHLYEFGHTDLLWIGPEPENNFSSTKRLSGFRATCNKLRLTGLEICAPDFPEADKPWSRDRSIDAAYTALMKNRGLLERATGIVCYNDSSAFAVYKMCKEMGFSIPDDKSVAAFDDALAEFMMPPCTAASHMLREIGARAADIAVDMAEGKETYKGYRELIPSKVIIRKSTGPVKTVVKDSSHKIQD